MKLEIIKRAFVTNKGKDILVQREIIEWLIKRAENNEKLKEQLSELICAVYEHANEGTELMEIAERIDEMEL